MQFRIADTFTESLGKLTGEEQKAVKTTAFDLQVNPAHPGLKFHRVQKSKDKNFWSVRVSGDLRVIVHKTASDLLMCYVDHHDQAYDWARKRKLETHPKTGAAQLVQLRETVKEIAVPRFVESAQPPPAQRRLFTAHSDDELLGYGVPPEWMADVRQATEESLFALAEHLPAEAAEALLELATGGKPRVPTPVSTVNPFEHPDAQRRFRLMSDVEELKRALEYPWEKWTVFLHPTQRDLVEKNYNGPARVAGSAGTGKTVVALHRAAYLARKHPKAKVLVATFSETLAQALRLKLRVLLGGAPDVLNRIFVHSMVEVGRRLYTERFGEPALIDEPELRALLGEASSQGEPHRFTDQFLWTEWNEVVDAWQIDSWEAYRDVARLGRKTRLGEERRRLLWGIFARVRETLADRNLLTAPMMFARATPKTAEDVPFDFAVIDEAQDLAVDQLRFLAALGGNRPDGLFFAGDLGQRIFQAPFSWKSLGVDIRGRSKTLRINYRTSHQIRVQADRLLPPELSDVDGNAEDRRGVVSAFDGPEPDIKIFDSADQERESVALWLSARTKEKVLGHEIGLFVRTAAQFPRAIDAVERAGLKSHPIEGAVESREDHVSIMPMHLAKGLEFRCVAVMACDDEILPLQDRIAAVADDSDLEEVYATERHLLYVACTRARDHLIVTGVEPASEFLDDLRGT